MELNDEVADWEEKDAGLEKQIKTLKAENEELRERLKTKKKYQRWLETSVVVIS